jgi:hypothetical protein
MQILLFVTYIFEQLVAQTRLSTKLKELQM